MIDLQTRPQPLQELSDLLEIPSPTSSYIPVKKREVTKVEINSEYKCDVASASDKFELVMPLSTDTGMLFKFMVNAEKKLSDFDGQAIILSHRRSPNPGITTTVEVKGSGLSNIKNKLTDMSEVEKVEEEPLVIANPPSFSSKPEDPLTSALNHIKRIYLSLKQTDTIRQELVPVLA
ncbi:hypothetical protein ACFLTB_01995 [Chloroflexota bacterium]